MVQVSSLVKKDLPLNLGDMMVGTDVVDPTKPVKNFTIQELNDFFFNGWQFEERSFVLDSSTPIYSGVSPNVNLNPHLVPNSPPGQFIVIDPRFSVWKTVHEPNNPLIDVSGQVPYLFIGQYRDATYSVLTSNSALQAGNFPGGVSTFPDIGIGTPATPTQSKNTICKLQLNNNYGGGSRYPVFLESTGMRFVIVGFGDHTFTGKATITTQIRYKYLTL